MNYDGLEQYEKDLLKYYAAIYFNMDGEADDNDAKCFVDLAYYHHGGSLFVAVLDMIRNNPAKFKRLFD